MTTALTQSLVELGLTKLETEIYVFLLRHPAATGYSIAKGIGKPDANIYRAIESLQRKGAIIVEDGQTKLCRAISPEELIDGFQRRFDDLKRQAKAALKDLKPSPVDSRIYQLQTPDQVILRFRKMFASSRSAVLLDFFPWPVQELRNDMLTAANRGVSITIQLYQPCTLPGIETVLAHDGDQIIKRWPGMWANGVFDGEEYLLSFFSRDARSVIQAVWSNNEYLSWIYFSEITHEIIMHHLEDGFRNGLSVEEMKELFNRCKEMTRLKRSGYKDASSFFLDGVKAGKQKRPRS